MARIKIGNIKGPQGPIGPTGPQGPRGETGPQGPLPPLTNNGLATVAGVSALDAAYGKTLTEKDAELQKQIDTTNSNLKQQNILWSGTYIMHSGQTIALTSKVSEQKTGIILQWSGYDASTSTVSQSNFAYTVIPKEHTRQHNGIGITCITAGVSFWIVGAKYVYVYDTKIVGSDHNNAEGTSSGITWDNKAWVLTKVIGF